MKTVLFIAHYFPPIGGAGVQRAAKFVKYLPSFGIRPVVLTGTPRANGHWTPSDDSLMKDIPKETPVFRTAPDPSTGTASGKSRFEAYLEGGDELIKTHRPSCIFVTMSPFADSQIAAALAQRHGIPWVADLRDAWALDEFQVYRTRWHRKAAQRQMRRSLASAARIIMNTPAATEACRHAFPELDGRLSCITNGYDADDFACDPPGTTQNLFTIVHSGYFHAEAGLKQSRQHSLYALLGRTERGVRLLPRSHYYLLRALEQWHRLDPSMSRDVRMVCIGVPTTTDQALVRESAVADLISFTGYQPHSECLKMVRNADLLFLPLYKLAPGRKATVVPGKTYEYMAAERPILGALPSGDARDFLSQSGLAKLCEPDDVEAMASILKNIYASWKKGNPAPAPNRGFIQRFERRHLAARLSEILNKVS